MDALYFIKVIIEGKDNLSPSLRTASATMRTELQKLKNEVKGVEGAFGGAAGGQSVFARASRNSTEEAKRSVNAFRDVKKNVSEVANAFRASKADMDKFEKSGSAVERMLFRAGAAFRGAGRAIYDTQRGVRDMDFATRRAEGSIFNLAYNGARNLDNFVKSFTRMNTIAALLAPLLFTAVQAVLQLGAALVSLASAAAEAGAAVGGALLAGLMQLVPVVGVLIISLQRLQLIMQAYKLQQKDAATGTQTASEAAKAHREAVERLADSTYNLAQAYQNVKNQAYDVAQAEQALANTRREAARALVDSQNARVDAVLAERGAVLSLRDAKLQLAQLEQNKTNQQQLLRDRKSALDQARRAVDIARAQGDAGQLSVAEQQLGVAQSNYGALAGAGAGLAGQETKLREDQARLAVDEAGQRRKEAQVTLSRAIADENRLQKYGVDHAPEVVRAQHNITTATQQLADAHRNVAKAIREHNDAASDLKNKTYSGANAGGDKQLESITKQLDPVEKNLLATITRFMNTWKRVSRPITDAVLKGINDALDIIEKRLLGDSKFMKAWEGLGKVIGDSIKAFATFISSPQQKHFFESFIDLAGKNLPKIVSIFERVLSLVERIALAFAPVFEHILGGTNAFLGRQINRADARAPGAVGATTPGGGGTRLGAFATESQGFLKSLSDFFGSLFHLLGAIGHVAKGPGKDAFDSLTDTFNAWAQALRGSKEKGGQEFFANAIKTSSLLLKLFGQLISIFFKLASGSGFNDFVKTFGTIFVPALERFGKWYGAMFSIVVKAGDWGGLGKLLSWVTSFYLLSKLTPLGQLTSSLWHVTVLALLRTIAINTGVNGAATGKLAKMTGLLGKISVAPLLVIGAAALGYAIGTVIAHFLPKGVKETIGGGINRVASVFGLGVDEGGHRIEIPPSAATSRSQIGYLYRLFQRLVRRGMSPEDAADRVRDSHPGALQGEDFEFVYNGKSYASGGTVGGGMGQAVPIVAHAGEWVLNHMQQMKVAQMLGRPINWIREHLFGQMPSSTTFGNNRDMLADWNDQQYDANGNQIYSGTVFVETPLGQWVQLARQTLAKMQRQPGWLPKQLLQTAGFRGASAQQLQDWSGRFYKFQGNVQRRGYAMGGVVMPHFAQGGVVTTPAAGMGGTKPVATVPQTFQIHTASPKVDIDYVMRVAKMHAEASF